MASKFWRAVKMSALLPSSVAFLVFSLPGLTVLKGWQGILESQILLGPSPSCCLMCKADFWHTCPCLSPCATIFSLLQCLQTALILHLRAWISCSFRRLTFSDAQRNIKESIRFMTCCGADALCLAADALLRNTPLHGHASVMVSRPDLFQRLKGAIDPLYSFYLCS